MRTTTLLPWLAVTLLPLGALHLACADSYLAANESAGAGDEDGYGDDDMAGDDDYAGDDDDAPPEQEDDFISVPPSPGDVFVFVVNPSRDSVTKVDVVTRQITTIEVGDEPSQVVVTADYTRAVVFNDGEDSVSVVDPDTDEVSTVDVREDFNYLALSPTGQHAVCYLNVALMEEDSFNGVLSYTEVSVVDLDSLTSHDFSVGFNPKQVKFVVHEDLGVYLAVIISNEYLTVIDLSEGDVEPQMIDLEADPFDPPTAAEVELEPTGEFAFIRYQGEDLIQVVDLWSGELSWLIVGGEPTDMDLSPEGDELMVVSRANGELRTFDSAGPEDDPRPCAEADNCMELPSTETIGSVSMAPVGDLALLYTTATLTDRVTVWDRSTGDLTVRRLEKPVAQVIMSPDGESMVVVHTLADTEGESDIYTDHHVMTIVTIADGAFVPNAVLLEDELDSLANFDDGVKGVFMMANNRNVGIIDYPSRLVDDILVPSYPIYVGVMPEEDGLPDPVAWISQDHPLGRMSFAEPDTLDVQTVTGFELNSGIE
jgi:hypothetical protein